VALHAAIRWDYIEEVKAQLLRLPLSDDEYSIGGAARHFDEHLAKFCPAEWKDQFTATLEKEIAEAIRTVLIPQMESLSTAEQWADLYLIDPNRARRLCPQFRYIAPLALRARGLSKEAAEIVKIENEKARDSGMGTDVERYPIFAQAFVENFQRPADIKS